MLAEARDALELSEASKTLAANELRELRAALAQARALAEQLKQMSTEPGPWAQRVAYEYAADELAALLGPAPDGAR